MKSFYFISALIWISFARTYYDDTLIVRKILDMNGNQRICIDSISDSVNGRIATLGLTDIDSLPGEISGLDSLKNIDLFQKNVVPKPKLWISKEFWKMQSLTGLWIFNAYLDIPDEISGLINLKTLNISYSGIASISSEIWNLANLENLYISSVSLGDSAAPIGNLKKLKTLYFRYDKEPPLFTLPVSLESIVLEQNGYKPLPSQLFTCANLRSLIIRIYQADTSTLSDSCGLDTLPKEIGNLKELSSLNLENTHLKLVPDEISELTKLKYLIVRTNELRELPQSIVLLKGICLDVDENSLCNPPENIQQWIDSCSCTSGWRTSQECSDLVKEIRLSDKKQEFKIQTNNKARTTAFFLPQQAKELSIYDASGRLVYSLASPRRIVIWRGTNYSGKIVTKGVYIVKVATKTSDFCKPFMITR